MWAERTQARHGQIEQLGLSCCGVELQCDGKEIGRGLSEQVGVKQGGHGVSCRASTITGCPLKYRAVGEAPVTYRCVGAATLVSRVTAAMQLDQFCREHEELLGVLGELWELAEPGSDDQQRAMALVTQVLHRQLVWLVAEADRLELVSELALTTAPMATGMATGQ